MHSYWFVVSLFTRKAYGDRILVDLIKVLTQEVHAREVAKAAFTNGAPPTEGQLRSLFDAFDESGDGEIDLDELQTALNKAGKKVSYEKCVEILHRVDTNSNGLISYDEFVQIFKLAPSLRFGGRGLVPLGTSGHNEATCQIVVPRDDLIDLVGQECADVLLVGFGADPPADEQLRDDTMLGHFFEGWFETVTTLIQSASPVKGGGGNWSRRASKDEGAHKSSSWPESTTASKDPSRRPNHEAEAASVSVNSSTRRATNEAASNSMSKNTTNGSQMRTVAELV